MAYKYKVEIRTQVEPEKTWVKVVTFEGKLMDYIGCKSEKKVMKVLMANIKRDVALTAYEQEHIEIHCPELMEAWRQWHAAEMALPAVRDLVLERWTLGPTHGIGHWNRVWENGQRLLNEEVDPVVVLYFAYLHDSCRLDDGGDWEHGGRAAEWIVELRDTLLSVLTDEQFEKLQTACRLHTEMQSVGDATVDACFDADRLDLWRVGVQPLPRKMATYQGARLARNITFEGMMRMWRKLRNG